MKFGVSMFATDYSIAVPELAKAMEDLGFESLFVPEHTHIPASRQSPWPGGPNLPKEYSHSLDPFVALSAAASVTKRLLLGTGVCLLVERDPITTAKAVASLDHISGGRFLFGIGGGWNLEEMANHGTKPSLRWKILRERVLAMKAIWANDEAEYHGQYVDFDPIWAWPKPIQRPHPPILMGGSGPRTFERVVEFCDGWLPIPARLATPLPEMLAELDALAKAAGRGHIPTSIFNAPAKEAVLAGYAAAGVARVVFSLPSAPAGEALPRLKQLAELTRVTP